MNTLTCKFPKPATLLRKRKVAVSVSAKSKPKQMPIQSFTMLDCLSFGNVGILSFVDRPNIKMLV